MSKETVSTLLTCIFFVVLVIGFAFMLRENTRLKVFNQHLEHEVSQTRAVIDKEYSSGQKAYADKDGNIWIVYPNPEDSVFITSVRRPYDVRQQVLNKKTLSEYINSNEWVEMFEEVTE